jgi:hypothetical protein
MNGLLELREWITKQIKELERGEPPLHLLNEKNSIEWSIYIKVLSKLDKIVFPISDPRD